LSMGPRLRGGALRLRFALLTKASQQL
jgi:hypothetical protein